MDQMLNSCRVSWAIAALTLLCQSCLGADFRRQGRCLAIYRLDEGIYFGAAPKNAADFVQLKRLGVKHVIDVRTFLRCEGAIERWRANRSGMTYRRIPIGYFPTKTGNVPKFLAQLDPVACGPIYFHCNLGRDRAGMLVAIYRTGRLGWDACKAWNAWNSNRFNSALKDLDRYFWQTVAQGTRNRSNN